MAHHDLLRIEDLTVSHGQRPAVHHLTATMPCGSLVAVLGPNGAGKSTLLRAMMGWNAYDGRILVDGEPARRHRQRIAYVPQRDNLDIDFPITVREVIEQGRYQRLGWWRGFAAADHADVAAAMEELHIDDLAERTIDTLSGGQLQRVLLARALATGADIFLLDEPLNGLDAPSRMDLLDRLRRWTTDHERVVLAVLHDLSCLDPWFSHGILLRTHLIAAGPIATVATPANLRAAYGDRLDAPAVVPLRVDRSLFAGATKGPHGS